MKIFVKKSLLFSISLIGIIICLEIFFQTTHIVDKTYNDIYEDIGIGRRTNFSYVFFNEGFSFGKFNAFRYLGPSYPAAKDSSSLRIALLGDSYVEGFQVFDRHHFRSILEKNLSVKLNNKVEVLNFGRSGFNIGDMYAYKKVLVDKFSPDLVLFFVSDADFIVVDDPLKLKLRLKHDSILIRKEFPGRIVSAFNKTKVILMHSTIINLFNICRKTIKRKGIFEILLDKFYHSNYTFPKHADLNKTKTNPIVEKVLCSMSNPQTIIINRDNNSLNTSNSNLITKYHLNFLDLKDTLNVLRDNGLDPNFWKATKKTGHWNQQAHEAVGIYLSEKLYDILKENPKFHNKSK